MSYLGSMPGAAASSGDSYTPVADVSELLALSPSNEDRAFVTSKGIFEIYLTGLGQGQWVPERFTTGDAGSIVLHPDVEILLNPNNITGLTDTDDATSWPNVGTSGNFAEATNPPSWHETAGADGRAVIRFAGASEIMSCADNAAARNTGRGMAAALFKPATVSATDRCLLNLSRNTDDFGLFYLYYDTIQRIAARRVSADTGGTANTTTNGRVPSAGAWTIILGIADWTDNHLVVESDTVTTYTLGVDATLASTGGNTEDLDHNSVTIGKSGGLSDAADCDVMEIWFIRDEVFDRGDLVILGKHLEMLGGL